MSIPMQPQRLPKAAYLEGAEISWAYRQEFSMWLCLLLWAGWWPE